MNLNQFLLNAQVAQGLAMVKAHSLFLRTEKELHAMRAMAEDLRKHNRNMAMAGEFSYDPDNQSATILIAGES